MTKQEQKIVLDECASCRIPLSSGDIEIFTDGACLGNPGQIYCGFKIRQQETTICSKVLKFQTGTSNSSEYLGVISALSTVLALEGHENKIDVYTDSKLLYNHFNQIWNCKSPTLLKYYKELTNVASNFPCLEVHWLPRKHKRIMAVDYMIKEAIKGGI